MKSKYYESNSILNILVAAKSNYIQHFAECVIEGTVPFGMCHIIDDELMKHLEYDGEYGSIIKFIPEFNPDFLKAKCDNINRYWWHISDTKSRIKAFDKLINLYKQKVNENSL